MPYISLLLDCCVRQHPVKDCAIVATLLYWMATFTENDWFTLLCCCKLLSVWMLIYIYLHCVYLHKQQAITRQTLKTSLTFKHLASLKSKKNGCTTCNLNLSELVRNCALFNYFQDQTVSDLTEIVTLCCIFSFNKDRKFTSHATPG